MAVERKTNKQVANIRMATHSGQPVDEPSTAASSIYHYLRLLMIISVLLCVLYIIVTRLPVDSSSDGINQVPKVVTQLYEQHPELAEYNRSLIKQIDGFRIASQGLAEQLSSLKAENESLQQRYMEISEVSTVTLDVAQQEISQLMAGNTHLNTRLKESAREIQELKRENTKITQRLAKLQEQYRDTLDIKNTALKLVESESARLSQRNSNLMQEFETLLAEKKQLVDKAALTEASMVDIKSALQQEKQQRLNALRTLQGQVNELADKSVALNTEKKRIAASNDTLRERIAYLDEQLQLVRKDSQTRLAEKNKTIADTESQMVALIAEVDSYKQQLSQLDADNRTLSVTLKQTQTEYASLDKKFEVTVQRNNKADAELTELQSVNQTLTKQIQDIRESMATLEKLNTEQKNQLITELGTNRDALKASDKQLALLKDELKLSLASNDNMESRLATYKLELDKMREKAGKQSSESAIALNKLTQSNSELLQHNESLSQRLEQLEQDNQVLNQEATGLRQAINEESQSREQAQQEKLAATAKYATSVALLEGRKSKLESQVQKLQTDLDKQREDAAAKQKAQVYREINETFQLKLDETL